MQHIGITTSWYEPPADEAQQTKLRAYLDMLEDGGARGELLWIPSHAENAPESERRAYAAQLAERLDGLILSGGADLPPQLWGEEPAAEIDPIDPARPAFELLLVPEFVRCGKPVLGICYGCQLLNVWRGGTLVQDIPTQWSQPIEHRDGVLHPVQVGADSLLHRITGLREFEVASFHHQAIGRAAAGGAVSAHASDRLPEAIEFADAPFLLGVQWHPERTRESDATQRLTRAFLRAQ